ncbi:hypothetical protein PV327_000429 [Microctonus hyperodae]|uniref:Uncharacterized protein n=1 Tax=Microctonus hyperodae TaxID=165561 RepID=A0AA39L256_MICHY|nr:hypothetical protein PV327_000429 [Microctonus hyperodae]
MAKFIILCLNVLFIRFAIAEVPSYIHVCGRRDPKIDECIKNSIEKVRPKLISGIPEYDVPPLNPLFIENKLTLAATQGFTASASNVTLYNMENFEIKSLHTDLENKKFITRLYFDKMKLQGDYEFSAKILVPIETKGFIDLDAEGIDAHATISYTLRDTKKGKQFFFTGIKLKLDIADYKARFVPREGLEPTIADAVNAVINTNRREITDSMVPGLEKAISAKIIEISNKICKHFTYIELFPDRE